MCSAGLRALAAALLVSISAAALTAGANSSCEFDAVPRIVAVGDVHGVYRPYVEILRTAGILDRRDRWAGGKTHFVQVGDMLDRGDESRKVLDLLQRLERQASAAGGRVHVLLGNHEAMRMLGDMRYVTPGEYGAFTTGDSIDVRRQVIESYPEEQRAELFKNTPLGMIEMFRAYGPKGPYGMFLRRLNAVVRINGIVFLHGGLSPPVAPLPCGDLNATVRRELTEDLDKTRNGTPADSLTTREDGPLWYRGLAQEPETFAPQVDAILAAQKARAIVVGHTVTPAGRVVARFDGRVFTIDTGMNPDYVKNGRASALEIRDNVFTAIYTDTREILPGPRDKEDR